MSVVALSAICLSLRYTAVVCAGSLATNLALLSVATCPVMGSRSRHSRLQQQAEERLQWTNAALTEQLTPHH